MILPPSRIQQSTAAVDNIPATTVMAQLNSNTKHLESLEIAIGEKMHKIESEAIGKIGAVNLSTMEVRTEIGRSGKRWFTVSFRPSEPTKHPTRYHVSIVGDEYMQTTTSWNIQEGEVTRVNSKVLHERPKK